MGALLVRALGPLEVVVDGLPVRLGGAKQRVVLACLILRANSVVSVDALVDAVWPEKPPARPTSVLQVYVANLRRLLEPDRAEGSTSTRLVSRPPGYSLVVRDAEVDLLQFQERVSVGHAAAEEADLTGAAESLRQAVSLFSGPVFPDLADVETFRAEVGELEERRLSAYQDLLDIDLALGRHASVLAEVQTLIAQHPFCERLWGSLVLALYRCDRQADALAASRQARRALADELGIDPGPALQQLERDVLRQDPSLAAPATPGQRRVRQRLDNIPATLTSLVGREADLDELESELMSGSNRLITVTGPGGTGKTRLALAAASRIGPVMADGVCWVELAPLTDSGQVPGTLAAALGVEVRNGSDPLVNATSFLRRRRLLLVLDNFEHIEAAWPTVLHLLTAAPGLLVLVTSRRALQVRGEYDYELGPLELPPSDPQLPLRHLRDVPAVRLFVTRGQAAYRHFSLTDGNAATVTRICRRLDGLPLALELAAAQLRHRTPEAILHDVETSVTALPAAIRGLPERQVTLTATMSWSYELLDKSEQDLFDQLGVFASDPTVAAVDSICTSGARSTAETAARLGVIADHSLLRRYTDPVGEPRVAMLQAIREFARDRLDTRADAVTVRRRHARYFLAVAETFGPRLFGPDQVSAFQRLQADAADLRSALAWAGGSDGSTLIAARLIGQLWHYWELTGDVADPCATAQTVVACAQDMDPGVAGPALSGTATMCWMLGRGEEATRLHGAALDAFAQAGDGDGVAWSRMCLGVQALEANELDAAQRLTREALTTSQASYRTRACASAVLGLLAFYAHDHPRAHTLYEQSLDLARRTGDRWLLDLSLGNLAESAEQRGEYDTAEALLVEALQHSRQLGASLHAPPASRTSQPCASANTTRNRPPDS
jgi:predicted ATPase/DNA-binding SARP family transcriptional activator